MTFALSVVCATSARAQPTLEFLDLMGHPAAAFREFEPISLLAHDPALAGSGTIVVHLASQLRGDEEWVVLAELPSYPGYFSAEIPGSATLDPAPPAIGNGTLEVTEIAGPPLQRDSLVAELLACSAAPCPEAEADIVGNSLRLLDAAGLDLATGSPPFSLTVEAWDYAGSWGSPIAVTLTSGGDSETLTLLPYGQPHGRFRGAIAVAGGVASPGDGVLQTMSGASLGASRPDPLGLSTASDTLTIDGYEIAFLDREGNETDRQVLGGPLRLRVAAPGADLDGGALDTLQLSLRSLPSAGGVRDSETLTLTETGVATAVFEGQLPSRQAETASAGDGELAAMAGSPADAIEASVGIASASAVPVTAILRLVDLTGAEAGEIWGTTHFYLELEAPSESLNPALQEQLTNSVNISSGDSETVTLYEQGMNSAVFRADIYLYIRNNFVPNILEGRLGDTLSAFRVVGGAALLAEAELVPKPGNLPPVVTGETLAVPQGSFAVITDPLANDSDPETYFLLLPSYTQPAHGVVDSHPSYPGSLRYTPLASYAGSDAFTYTVADPAGATAVATVQVNVFPVDHPPVAVADAFTLAEDGALAIEVLANDYDVDGDAITLLSFSSLSAQGGQVSSVAAPFNFLYRPKANFNGTDSFTYRIIAGDLTATGTVTFTVTPVNDPPTAVSDSVTTPEDVPRTIAVLANDSDPEGDAFVLESLLPGTQNVVANADGTVTFTPASNFFGSTSFGYKIRDAGGQVSAQAYVYVTVTAVNDPPVAVDDVKYAYEDTQITLNLTTNDSDPDSPTPTVKSVTQPSHGTVTLISGTVRYLSHQNYSGSDTFTYTVTDTGGLTATANVFVTVTGVNDAPVAVADAATVTEDVPLVIDVLANDSDVDGDVLDLIFVTQPTRGALTKVSAGGRWQARYAPQLNTNGSDSFSYRVVDPAGLSSATRVVSLTVTPVYDPPTAANDSATTAEDTAVTIAVMANDTNGDSAPLTMTASLGAGTTGTVTVNANKTLTYVPGLNYNGTTGFIDYQISDGTTTASARVNLTVTAVNDPPLGVDDVATTLEEQMVSIPVLANDSDPEGPVTLYSVSTPLNGTAVMASGAVNYTPKFNFHGADVFSYTVRDSAGLTRAAFVTVTVTPVNDAPFALSDSVTIAEDTTITVDVLANDTEVDGDTMSVIALLQGTHGTATFAGSEVTYTPVLNYYGTDSVRYTVSDGNGGTADAYLNLTITAVNDPPGAVADAYDVAEDGSGTFAVLANDSDPENQAMTIIAASGAVHGGLTFTTNRVTYTPAADYSGPDAFTYTVRDSIGLTATGSVTVTVTPVNDAPVAQPDIAATDEDAAVTVPVLANDSDPEGQTLTVTGVGAAAHGTVGFTSSSVTYTPAADYSGPDAFSYTIADSQGATATATASIAVTAVNDPPVAANDSAITSSGSSVTVAVLQNDSDPEGDALTVSAVGAPLHGSAVAGAGNTVTYTPAAGYSGPDSFTYTVSDGGATATATVAVTVNNALGQVALLGLRSVQLETGADVLSGDLVVNAAEPPPYLGATELVLGSGTTVAAGWDVRANGVTVAAGATIAADITSNGLANSGTLLGATFSPLAVPVFAALPTLQTATPGASDVNVATNGAITLAPGVYRDLIVAKKGVVTFSGGVYVFRSITIQREASLLFSAPGTVKVEGRMSTATMTRIQPATVSTATAATIVFHIAGINGSNGALASTPKAVEIATDNVLQANFYVPNGTLWLQARTTGNGSFIGRHVRVGPDVQISLASAW